MSKVLETSELKKDVSVDRRGALRLLGLGAVAATAGTLAPMRASATPESAGLLMDKLSGSKSYKSGKVTLKTPAIAENGATVPVSISVDSPMTDGNYVKSVHLAADQNPRPEVASFHFTPASGKAKVSTRLRLSKSQNIIAVAVMNDGSVYKASKLVKVTIGGCGG